MMLVNVASDLLGQNVCVQRWLFLSQFRQFLMVYHIHISLSVVFNVVFNVQKLPHYRYVYTCSTVYYNLSNQN